MEEVLSTAFQQDRLDIIGKGQGANKTDTNVHGITITEDFGVNDELFLHWQIPERTDKTQDIEIHMDWAPIATEVGKTFSIQINISAQGNGTLINDEGQAFLVEDISVTETAFQSFAVRFTVPKAIVSNGYDDLHIKIRRIASSNELISDIALHHASIEYQIHQV
jgi:hypothetical protein